MAYKKELSAAAANTTVLDTDGEPVRGSYRYYISLYAPSYDGWGLTLTPKTFDSPPCPLYVGQDFSNELARFLPAKFHPIDSEQDLISLSSDLNVDFGYHSLCEQSTTWRVTPDETTGRMYVGTGGVIGNRTVKTDWFKIEKSEMAAAGSDFVYKLVYCDGGEEVNCGNLGLIAGEDGFLLGIVAHHPLLVSFTKLDTGSPSSEEGLNPI